MSLERAPLAHDDVADQNWFAPLAILIAWLAHLFEQIAKLKRIRTRRNSARRQARSRAEPPTHPFSSETGIPPRPSRRRERARMSAP